MLKYLVLLIITGFLTILAVDEVTSWEPREEQLCELLQKGKSFKGTKFSLIFYDTTDPRFMVYKSLDAQVAQCKSKFEIEVKMIMASHSILQSIKAGSDNVPRAFIIDARQVATMQGR